MAFMRFFFCQIGIFPEGFTIRANPIGSVARRSEAPRPEKRGFPERKLFISN
jgi:hypothetical protein